MATIAADGVQQQQQQASKLRRIQGRLETPNAEREPVRYQWYTRPYEEENDAGGLGGGERRQRRPREQDRLPSQQRVDSDDILEAVRGRIRSPTDWQIRNRMQRMPPKQDAINGVLAHYLAESSLADSVLNHRLSHPQPPTGCACCASVNYVNKAKRQQATRGVVPLTDYEQMSNASRYYYNLSPDEKLGVDDHRLLVRAATPQYLKRTEEETRLQANLQRLQQTIQVLNEPVEQAPEPYRCTVAHELEPDSEYFRPGVVPTKYLAFAPKNPLRHPPPGLNDDDYRDRKRTGRMKYVSFSPRNPELQYYSTEDN